MIAGEEKGIHPKARRYARFDVKIRNKAERSCKSNKQIEQKLAAYQINPRMHDEAFAHVDIFTSIAERYQLVGAACPQLSDMPELRRIWIHESIGGVEGNSCSRSLFRHAAEFAQPLCTTS